MYFENVLYKLISLAILALWIGLWKFLMKTSFSKNLALFVFIGGTFLIAAYPMMVLACDKCSLSYAVEYVILATIIFFLLLGIGYFSKFIFALIRNNRIFKK